jgi:site-specific DNA recombinase
MTKRLCVKAVDMMDPALVAEFVATFSEEWNRLIAEHRTGSEARRRELHAVERKIANLIDALSEGIRSPDLKTRMATMEEQRAILMAGLAEETTQPPAMHPNLAQVYRDKVARLREALRGPDGTEALEAARELVEQVIVPPPENDDNPPGIEVIGEFVAMLKAAGLGSAPRRNQAENADVLRLLAITVKEGPGGQSPLAFPSLTPSRSSPPLPHTPA